MTDMQLWWVDNAKILRVYALGSDYPKDIQSSGRLYLNKPNPDEAGSYLIYNLSAIPNIDLSTITSSSKIGEPVTYRLTDTTHAKAYDVLRRSGWSVKHTNKADRVKDDPLRSTIDQDLVIATNEITDLSNVICFVNGLYHRSALDPNSNEVYVTDGAQTLRANRTKNDVTLIDFTPTGGCKIFPLVESFIKDKTTVSKSILLDLSSLKLSLRDYTPYLIVDGYIHHPGYSHRSINDTTIEVTTAVLDLLKNYLTSSYLRNKVLPIPVIDGNNPTSDIHDSELDVFVKNTKIDKSTVVTDEWLLSRLLSTHSAILLLPKTTVAYYQSIQHETNESSIAILPTKATTQNGLLDIDGKKFSPLYIHTKGYRDRTIVSVPYKEDRKLWSLLDPNRTIVASPDRDVIDPLSTFTNSYITRWTNIPALGEFR